jgi:hypothetical protein
VPPFPHPGIRKYVLEAVSGNEGWVRSWLDTCEWLEGEKTVLCPRAMTVAKLREHAPGLEARGLTLAVKQADGEQRSAA